MRVTAGDPQATPPATLGNDLDALAAAVARVLLRDGRLAEQLVRAAERVAASGQRHAPGQLLPGTVSTLAGALIAGPPMRAMVYLGGATHAVACYVAPHVQTDLAAGQDVWVEPVNGSRADLWIVGIRAFNGTPLAQQALTAANNAQSAANAAQSTANTAESVHNVYWLSGTQQIASGAWAAAQSATIQVTGNYGVPSGATAVHLYGVLQAAAAGSYFNAAPGATAVVASTWWACGNVQVANQYDNAMGWCPLDSSGRLTLYCGGGGTLGLYITGYSL